MTAYDVPGLKEIARRLMVNEVIRKPVPAETICRIVVRALEICGYGPIGRASDAERKEMEGGKDPFVGEEPNRGYPSP
jgi:hypothetical protein